MRNYLARIEEDIRVRALRPAIGPWISTKFDWRWFVTLTFKDDGHVSERRAQRALLRWFHTVAKIVADGQHVPVAYGRERQLNRNLHFHLLVATPPPSPDPGAIALGWSEDAVDHAALLDRLWRISDQLAGRTHVRTYERGGGAGGYLAKGEDWDVAVACPRRMRCRRPGKGCVEAAKILGAG